MKSEFYPPRKQDRPKPPLFYLLRTIFHRLYRDFGELLRNSGRMLGRVFRAMPLALIPGYYYFRDRKYPHGMIVLLSYFCLLVLAIYQTIMHRRDYWFHPLFFVHSIISYQALFDCLNRGVTRKHRVPLYIIFICSIGVIGVFYYHLWVFVTS